MVTVSERIVIPFEGEGAGTGPLAWGQAENWLAVLRLGSCMPVGGIRVLAPGEMSVEDVVGELGYAMSRFPAARTLLRFDPDGRPTQVVYGSGEVTLEIVDVGDDGDADAAAAALSEHYERPEMDFTTEWPIRMGVVRRRGQLTHMVVFMSHFMTDGGGTIVMINEIAIQDRTPVDGLQPLDQARWQASPSGRRQNEVALRYWDGVLRTIEPRRFPAPTVVAQPRYWECELLSTAMTQAMRRIAERTRANPASIVLAAYAVALHRVTGINPVVVRPLVGNRFRPGFTGIVCTATQASLCVLDVADLPFDEALRRVKKATMMAYKLGYFNPDDVAALVAKVNAERGVQIQLGAFINDRRNARPSSDGPSVEPSDCPPSTFRWILSRDSPAFEPLMMDVEEIDGATQLIAHFDAHYISPDDAETFLRGMETAMIEACE